ncbi:protein DBF4 homolog A [Xyrichtys novacula]|uniref:Protein DBF4 homolog A n=1 Tax=Xyrichtys novacula TaxID=13765 RepID=A0AAV1FN65_XYRNO|nr:protein DBF4 homolog A [Xyrichtys novacula]
MKPKRSRRHSGSTLQGKNLGAGGEKSKLSQVKPANVVPFAGKVFYLDLPSNRIAEKLELDIKELGGTVEKFFSKEIKYLVSNKREARYVHRLKQDSPVPSPDSGQSSPHPRSNLHRPGSHGDSIKNKSQGQTETLFTSRGKSLVEKVVKEQERVQMNKILSNALEWGVKILYLDDILAYVQKKKKTVCNQRPAAPAVKTTTKTESAVKHSSQRLKGGQIKKPFIKVEDSSKHYRPIYLTMPNIPEFNLRTLPPCSPFCVEDKEPPVNKQQGHRHSEEKALGWKKNRDKKRGGYCECCLIKYENLTMHLQSERHKAFSKSDEYLVVDRLVSTLPCNLKHIKTQVKRPKCSVSSVLVVPGPCKKTELSHKGGLDTAEIIEDEQLLNVDEEKGCHSGPALKLRPASTSAPLLCRERDRRSYYTHSNKSKPRSLERKGLCRQNPPTSGACKVGQSPGSPLNMETAPPRGETVASTPSEFSQADQRDQIQDKGKLSSEFNFVHEENKVSSKSLALKTSQQKETDEKQDSSACDNDSEEDETNPSTLNSSPVWKIKRKVKVYERKRRKMETRVEHVKPSETAEDSMLRLWELFQSSDDMEVEFLGF